MGASINPTVLLLTCKAVKDGGKENMCSRHGCLTTLTFADKACAGAENKGSAHSESSGKPSEAHQLYDGLRQYVQCNTKAETLKCTNFAGMNAYALAVNRECCTGPGESCRHGFPSKCDAGCAEVLPGFVDACGDFLSSPMNVGIKQAVDEALAKCKSPGSRFGPNGGGH